MKNNSKQQIDNLNAKEFGTICQCGTMQDSGVYKCCNCGQKIYLAERQVLVQCPRCNQTVFEVEN